MSFVNEKPIKATRKRHICGACNKWIEPGESAINWAGMVDGDFYSNHYHPECREAEVAYNALKDWRGGDDWYALHEAEREDRPWLKAEHPLAYKRMLMSREQWAALATPTKGTPNDPA